MPAAIVTPRPARTAAAFCLAAALALAAPLTALGATAAPQPWAAQRRARLQERIEEAVRTRELKFDHAERRIGARADSVRDLASTVASAGGDVTGVLNMLTSAEESLQEAASIEADAVYAFRAVPGADDRRIAFAAARETARRAVDELREARQRVLGAAQELRRIAAALRAEQAP